MDFRKFNSRHGRRVLRVEEKAGLDQPPVPRERLLRSRFRFPTSSSDEAWHAFDIGHRLSEIVHTENGYWDYPGGFPSPVRYTSHRILGYLRGYTAFGDGIYRQRALEGIEHLLGIQRSDGCFPSFENSRHGLGSCPEALYETATAGLALLNGFRLTGDKRCLTASHNAARWEVNQKNFDLLAIACVEHLVEHFSVEKDNELIGWAIENAGEWIKLQLPSGGWPGKSSWMWNHGVITRGLAALYRVLPENHVLKPDLRSALIAALNRVLRQQMPSGEIPPNPHVKYSGHTCPHILLALLSAREFQGFDLEDCISGIMRYRLRRLPDEAFISRFARAWEDYHSQKQAAGKAATGRVMWCADMSRFVKDVDWGEVAAGTLYCYYRGFEPDPARVRWKITRSDRNGKNAQEITASAPFFGGMGWNIPAAVLYPGRRCRFTAHAKCGHAPIIGCSAYSGPSRAEWDAFTGCEITCEDAKSSAFTKVSVEFTASADTNMVYIWTGLEDGNASAELMVDDAEITDAGSPSPVWDDLMEDFDSEWDTMLLPPAMWLDKLS